MTWKPYRPSPVTSSSSSIYLSLSIYLSISFLYLSLSLSLSLPLSTYLSLSLYLSISLSFSLSLSRERDVCVSLARVPLLFLRWLAATNKPTNMQEATLGTPGASRCVLEETWGYAETNIVWLR